MDVLRQIITLAEKGTVERRCAALLVCGAIKLNHPQVVKIASAALEQANPVIKDYALRYFEEARPRSAMPQLSKLLDDSDKDIQERAVRLLIAAGEAAVPALLKRLPAAPRAWQLNAVRVLSAVRGKAAWKGLLELLGAGTDDLNKAVCDLMIPAMREIEGKEQDLLYRELDSFAGGLDPKEHRAAVVAAVRLLGQLGKAESRRWLFRLVGPEHHASVRAHALVALLRCLRDQELRKDESTKLLSLLEEKEFSEVTRLAIELLEQHALPEDARPALSRLLASPHESVQKFALRKMGDFATPAIVRTLVEQLGDPDYRRRDIAAQSLKKIPEARAALIKELIACADPSKAWSIAELVAAYEGKWRQETLVLLWKRLERAMAAEDRIQSAFMHVLKSANSDYLYERLAGQAVRLLKARKYREATAFLTALKQVAEMKPEDKFRLAVAQLKAHAHLLTPASRRLNPAVELLGDIYRSSAFPVFESLKKEKSLTAEDLYYLGFTLAERPGEERNLGRNLLEHIAARSPRTKLGKSARNKLKLLP
ncbi:MAG TPA: HEAT repeat domain-containing protein [Candidatus Acidoferrales bacterium]|nr:HEAT repeat domain-containing protein [Candidatus Acidoferrales bacterium]